MNKIHITPELAEICGIHAGDGYLRKRGNKTEIEIGGSKEEKSYYDNHVIPLFNRLFKLNLQAKNYAKGTYGFTSSSKQVAETLNKLGFPFGKKSLIVRIPKIILKNKDKSIYAKFLRGLLDTDGHIGFRKCYGKYNKFKIKHHHYPTIQIVTISQNLMKDTCLILDRLEIKYFVHGYQPKNLRDKYSYSIIINGVERLKKWMSLIGTKNPVKLSRYLIWKKFGFCPTNTTLGQREGILNGKLDIYSLSL